MYNNQFVQLPQQYLPVRFTEIQPVEQSIRCDQDDVTLFQLLLVVLQVRSATKRGHARRPLYRTQCSGREEALRRRALVLVARERAPL